MELTQSNNFNVNYSARIVKVNEFIPHPNPKCTRLKLAIVNGFKIAVSLDCKEGLYLYFPIECCINPTYLAANNLFRKAELNRDINQKGFFESNGRVKAIKLQGVPSEGLLMPTESISIWLKFINKPDIEVSPDIDFDTVSNEWLCKKYIIIKSISTNKCKISKKLKKGLNKVDDTQFRFHYDTTVLKRCPWVVTYDSLISITYKMHGTSGISSYVLCKKPLNAIEKFINLFKKDKLSNKRYYDYLWASRSVIKDPYYNPDVTDGFYNEDVWKYAHDIIKPKLKKGMTVYYEICGFLPNGNYIQKGFDYGCVPPIEGEKYTINKHFKVYVYRITYTNEDGEVFEFSAKQVQQWVKYNELTSVIEAYYGYAKDLYPSLDEDSHWNENFIEKLSNDENFYMEQDSPHCNNKVPHEGLVIKIENFKSEAYKVKCNKFLNKESELLDSGVSDIESES